LQTDIPGQEQGAQIVVKMATVPDDGPSGGPSTMMALCRGDGTHQFEFAIGIGRAR